MKKRMLSLTLAINLLFLLLTGKLFSLSVFPQTVATQPGLRVKDISSTRGVIYDRSLHPLVNNAYTYVACVKPTHTAINLLKSKNEQQAVLEKAIKGYFLALPAKTDIYGNTNDIKTLTVFERYPTNTALHLIGYTDSDCEGVCGIEKYFDKQLTESGGKLSVAYYSDATGRILLNEPVEIRNEGYYDKDGIVLTVDKNMQEITETALRNGNIDKGAAVVLDVKTSEILACASTPVYDRNNIAKYINNENSPFLNRALCAYPVGSVFKVVTAVSALENGIEMQNYFCNGSIEKSKTIFNCSNTKGHKAVDLSSALAYSCNPYFIELGTKIGARSLLTTAENLGFGKNTDLGNGYFTDSGILPQISELNSEAAVGNFAFGQGKFTATPLQIASLFATIGNNGIYNEPSLIKGATDKAGAYSPELKYEGVKVLKESTCSTIKAALTKTVTEGTGKSAFSSLFNSCSKTATAQSGQYDEQGNEIKYCWFAGFFPYESPEYVICILKENGVSGGGDCAPVFKEIAENIYINNKK
ncbi:MAG: penicillin-binding protein 2 [Clostridia bacterium]|nr:penicillin-binding protein 2 [Clostridia bacterium]